MRPLAKVPRIVTLSWNYFQAVTFSYHNAALYNILQRRSGLTVNVKNKNCGTEESKNHDVIDAYCAAPSLSSPFFARPDGFAGIR